MRFNTGTSSSSLRSSSSMPLFRSTVLLVLVVEEGLAAVRVHSACNSTGFRSVVGGALAQLAQVCFTFPASIGEIGGAPHSPCPPPRSRARRVVSLQHSVLLVVLAWRFFGLRR